MTVSPFASNYIANYYATVTAIGGGDVQVGFWVSGTRTMDSIGSTIIYLYEKNGSSWTQVHTYNYVQYPDLVGYDTNYHSGTVSYSGVSGKQYYAAVYLRASLDGGSDSRLVTTSTVVA
jgi:hypothetical protein